MYWHPYDIEARNQLAGEHVDRLERDMHSRKVPVQRGPGLAERIVPAFLPILGRRRTAAAAATAATAAAAEAAKQP
jgi:hypothetical protein